MKIVITYEKADLLCLVQADLRARGMCVKTDAAIDYRGALQVKLEVDADDEPVPASARPPKRSPDATQPSEPMEPEGEVAPESEDMEEVLRQARVLAKAAPSGRSGLERSLGRNESYEYPREP